MDQQILSKTCTKCGEVKPLSEFFKGSHTKDGLQYVCKVCTKAYDAARYAANPSKARARIASYRVANSDKVREFEASRYKANSDKIKARAIDWYKENQDRYKANTNAWRAANPEARRIQNHNRRSKKRESNERLSKGLSAKLFKLQQGKCACCGLPLGENYHLDHTLPLALGGSNTDDNIQLLRATCNQQKHAKHPVDFMQSRGYLL